MLVVRGEVRSAGGEVFVKVWGTCDMQFSSVYELNCKGTVPYLVKQA